VPSKSSPRRLSRRSGPNVRAALSAVKQGCRKGFAGLLYHSGALNGFRWIARANRFRMSSGLRGPRRAPVSKFVILCYHRVGTEGIPLFSRLQPSVFESQMKYLRKHYRLVCLRQLCREMQAGDVVGPTVAITFDDGYRDLYTHAFPVLRKYEIPATIYLIGHCMETGEAPWYDRIFATLESMSCRLLELELEQPRIFELSSPDACREAAWQIVCYLRTKPNRFRQAWCADFEKRFQLPQQKLRDRMLNWEQVRAMQSGGIHFAAHSMSHPVIARLAPAEFEEEFLLSKRLLESGLQSPVLDFAYPFGKFEDVHHPAARQYLEAAGYRSAATTIEGTNGPGSDLFALRRLQIGDDGCLSLFALNVGRVFFEAPSPASAGLLSRALG
jgi:peptidoglycan/xylan/chitin deacetylase (PgdA/CDA1 family)